MALVQQTTSEAGPVPGRHVARNYAPLPVEIAEGAGAWVTDTAGRRYLDMLAGYSALNFGHRHPALVTAARAQLERVTLTSRAFGNDQLDPFCAELAALAGKDLVLPMNTGAEAVETAIKCARKRAYEHKGVPADRARIVVFANNFHGRTTTAISCSTDHAARAGFGPFTPGFDVVPFGDAAAVADAVGPHTAAVLVEPIQGEAGVVVPPKGFLADVRRICDDAGALMIADEIQSGLGRTGATFACDHEAVVPDIRVLGKALGGGIVPLSAVVADDDVLGVFRPGEHGSTFGGNPLACAVGRAVVDLVRTGHYQQRAAALEAPFLGGLRDLIGRGPVVAVRGRGLWAGVDLDASGPSAHDVCERLFEHGLLCKDTHGHTLRLSPPLCITDEELATALDRIDAVLG